MRNIRNFNIFGNISNLSNITVLFSLNIPPSAEIESQFCFCQKAAYFCNQVCFNGPFPPQQRSKVNFVWVKKQHIFVIKCASMVPRPSPRPTCQKAGLFCNQVCDLVTNGITNAPLFFLNMRL